MTNSMEWIVLDDNPLLSLRIRDFDAMSSLPVSNENMTAIWIDNYFKPE